MSRLMATLAASILRYNVGLPNTRAQFLTSRQSSSNRVMVRTMLPSWTRVNSQIEENGTPSAHS